MARRKSVKIEIAYTVEELHTLIDNLLKTYDLDNYQFEIQSTSLFNGYKYWFIEIWKL